MVRTHIVHATGTSIDNNLFQSCPLLHGTLGEELEATYLIDQNPTVKGGGEAPKALSARVLVAAYWLFVVRPYHHHCPFHPLHHHSGHDGDFRHHHVHHHVAQPGVNARHLHGQPRSLPHCGTDANNYTKP